MEERRAHLSVDGRLGAFEEFRETYPDFCNMSSNFQKFSKGDWQFIVIFGEEADGSAQESDLMDLLLDHYNELGYLRENHAAEIRALLYIGSSHPAGMLSFDPEVLGLCAGLGIELQIHTLEE
jgi:hypothetical protein